MKFGSLLLAGLLFAAPVMADEDDPPSSGHVEARKEAPQIPSAEPSILVGYVKTERFRIAYTAKAEGAARALALDIERLRDLFAKTLGRDWPGVTEVRVGVGRAEYEAIALPGGKPPPWSVALAYPAHDIVLLDALSLNSPTGSQMLRHELSHVALGQIGQDWPRWFQEGLAMHLTGERYAVTQYAALFRAVTQDRVFHFDDLRSSWPEHADEVEIAYAQSVAFVDSLLNEFGSEKLGELLTEVGQGEKFETAFARVFKTTLTVEEEHWRKELPSRYSWWPIITTSSTLLMIAAVLTILAYARRRRQMEARLAEMTAQEAAEDAAERILAAEQEQAELAAIAIEEDSAASLPSDEAPPKPTIH
ncbi:MAG: peptidase MA family metallohydrolase [Myxococcaceae bacterium]